MGRALWTCGLTVKPGTCDCTEHAPDQAHAHNPEADPRPFSPWMRRLTCDREWCIHPECQEAAHTRRIGKWLPKLQAYRSWRYIVAEWPTERRAALFPAKREDGTFDHSALSKAANTVARTLKALGYTHGMRRWHPVGSPTCPNGCKKHKDGQTFAQDLSEKGMEWFCRKCGQVFTWRELRRLSVAWNPHLNILTPGGYIEDDHLEALKAALRAAVGEPDLIVHVQYVDLDNPPKGQTEDSQVRTLIHHLAYVTRATLRDWTWAARVAERLKGFRFSYTWGRNWPEKSWGDDQAGDELADVAALEAGTCPDCGGGIRWEKSAAVYNLRQVAQQFDLTERGGGYLRAQRKTWAPPPEEIEPGAWEHHRRRVRVVRVRAHDCEAVSYRVFREAEVYV